MPTDDDRGGLAPLTLAVAAGDPEALHAAARVLRDAALSAGRAATTAAGHSGELVEAWRGPAGDEVRTGLEVVVRYSRDGSDALRTAAAALDDYATTLAEVQARSRRAAGRLDDVEQAWAAATRTAAVDPTGGARAAQAAAELEQTRRSLRRQADQWDEDLAAAQGALRQRLGESTGRSGLRGAPTTVVRVRSLLAGSVPLLREHPAVVAELVRGAGQRPHADARWSDAWVAGRPPPASPWPWATTGASPQLPAGPTR